jgi:C_GCAxxG_C_C family probable redox protein
VSRIDRAVDCFKEGFSCSQAILSTYAQGSGIDQAAALRISAPFGGGMARMGATCGAVTGAFMVIGLEFSCGQESKEKVYSLVNEFVAEFKSRNRSIICKELLGCDISTPEGMKMAHDDKLIATRCPGFVHDAALILEDILAGKERL